MQVCTSTAKFYLVRTYHAEAALARVVDAVLEGDVVVVEQLSLLGKVRHGRMRLFDLLGLGRTDPGHGHAKDQSQQHETNLLERSHLVLIMSSMDIDAMRDECVVFF